MKKYLARVIPHFKKKVYCVYSYNGNIPDMPDIPTILKWDVVTVDLIDRIMKDDEWRKITINKLMSRGVLGVIIHDDNNWAAHGFISPPGVPLPDHLPKEIVKDYCWMIFAFVKPKWRGQGLQKIITKLLVSLFYNTYGQYYKMIGDTEVNNIPSRINFIKSTGFMPTGVITTIELRLPFSSPKVIWFKWNHNEKQPEL